jgi:hypothetical protein
MYVLKHPDRSGVFLMVFFFYIALLDVSKAYATATTEVPVARVASPNIAATASNCLSGA